MFNFLLFISLFSLNLFASHFNIIGEMKLVDKQNNTADMVCFIEPNEFCPYFFSKIVKERNGILIGVGTLRNLEVFSSGSFDYLLMLDYDQRVLDFNRQHLLFINELSNSFPDDVARQRNEYSNSIYKNYLANYHKTSELYYWQSDVKWERITYAIRNNHVFVCQGNLFNADQNVSLVEAINSDLRIKDLKRTLDFSNVFFHDCSAAIYAGFPDAVAAFSNTPENDIILITSLSPLDSDIATLLGNGDPHDVWTYYFSPLNSYLETIRQRAKSHGDSTNFINPNPSPLYD